VCRNVAHLNPHYISNVLCMALVGFGFGMRIRIRVEFRAELFFYLVLPSCLVVVLSCDRPSFVSVVVVVGGVLIFWYPPSPHHTPINNPSVSVMFRGESKRSTSCGQKSFGLSPYPRLLPYWYIYIIRPSQEVQHVLYCPLRAASLL
jgi:hypothetical protein